MGCNPLLFTDINENFSNSKHGVEALFYNRKKEEFCPNHPHIKAKYKMVGRHKKSHSDLNKDLLCLNCSLEMGLKGYKFQDLDPSSPHKLHKNTSSSGSKNGFLGINQYNFDKMSCGSNKKNSPDKYENSRRKKACSYFDEIRKISMQKNELNSNDSSRMRLETNSNIYSHLHNTNKFTENQRDTGFNINSSYNHHSFSPNYYSNTKGQPNGSPGGGLGENCNNIKVTKELIDAFA